MSDEIVFSIVVPTRNRRKTLEFCLNTCINQINAPRYEIVVNDNSTNDESERFVRGMLSQRSDLAEKLIYQRRSSPCSMSENFEEAILRARGKYVIVLGDDDGILPMALFEIQSMILRTKAKVIRWSNGLYNWPDMGLNDYANYLGFSTVRSFRVADGREELLKSIDNFTYDNLPMLYINAAISSDVIAGLRDGRGLIFGGRSPDVYSGIVISYLCGKFISLTVPLTIAGLSHASNGVSAAFGGTNRRPQQDYNDLNAKAGLYAHSHVPDLTIYPVVAFSESFYFAKGFHFSLDDEFMLSRKRVLRACAERSDVQDAAVREALYAACGGEPYLTDYVSRLISEQTEIVPPPRLKPRNLGADGDNLHLEAGALGIKTIEDAVKFVHNIVWPNNAPLRYDLSPSGRELVNR